jgi:glycosyltransferase involved in cell wall biosynthesis
MIPVTLIVVFCNRFRYVPDVVESVLAQKELENIVFVDNGSTDGTTLYLRRISRLEKAKIHLMPYLANIGKPFALQTEIMKCDTPFVCTMDGDVQLLNDNTILELYNAFQVISTKYDNVALLGASYVSFVEGAGNPDSEADTPPTDIIEDYQYGFYYANVAGGCQMLRTEIFKRLEGYQLRGQLYGHDDTSFAHKLIANKLKYGYVKNIKVKHLGDQDGQYFPEWMEIKAFAHKTNQGIIETDFRNKMEERSD